jgi:hypothetical protein
MALFADSCGRDSDGWKRLALLTQGRVGAELSVLRQVRGETGTGYLEVELN